MVVLAAVLPTASPPGFYSSLSLDQKKCNDVSWLCLLEMVCSQICYTRLINLRDETTKILITLLCFCIPLSKSFVQKSNMRILHYANKWELFFCGETDVYATLRYFVTKQVCLQKLSILLVCLRQLKEMALK